MSAADFTLLTGIPTDHVVHTDERCLWGRTVVITGTNFAGTTLGEVQRRDGDRFTVNSATQITTTVPVGATTGTITVHEPARDGHELRPRSR